jgi:hypothetical protein
MRSIRLAAVTVIVVLSLGLAASAASAKMAHPVVGDYSFTVHWTNPVINDTTSMDVAASGKRHLRQRLHRDMDVSSQAVHDVRGQCY